MADMFDALIRELTKLEENPVVLSVPLPADERGYLDRACPAEHCGFVFKVQLDDWSALFRDEVVYCPQCGHEAKAEEWWTEEQREHAEAVAQRHMETEFHRALQRSSRGSRRTFDAGLFQVSLKMQEAGHPPSTFVVPLEAGQVLEQELQCGQCGARYAVLGTAFFCPCCGHNSAEELFDRTLQKIEVRLDSLALIRKGLEEAGMADQAEDTAQALVEAAICDSVMAFQHYVESLYVKVPGTGAPPRNAFQRLDQGSELWHRATGTAYADILSALELEELRVLFQKRHVLAHRHGFVDPDYVDRSGDSTYRVGQRIVVTSADSRRLLQLVGALGRGLRATRA